MKNPILVICLSLLSFSSFAGEVEKVNPHSSSTKITILDENRTLVEYPFLKKLSRESVADVVYFGKNYSGDRICAHLGLGEAERGSKTIATVRAISTSNLVMNAIQYKFDLTARLSVDYQYPKTKVVKSIICTFGN